MWRYRERVLRSGKATRFALSFGLLGIMSIAIALQGSNAVVRAANLVLGVAFLFEATMWYRQRRRR